MVYGHIHVCLKKARCLMHGRCVRVNLMIEWHDFLLSIEELHTLLDMVCNVIFVTDHRPNLEQHVNCHNVLACQDLTLHY